MKVQIEQIGVDEGFLGKSVTKGDGFNIGIRKNQQRKGFGNTCMWIKNRRYFNFSCYI